MMMNANKRSLREMKREVFDVPHSLDECEARLKQLHEPPPFFYWGGRFGSRTKVLELTEANSNNNDSFYCVQRVHKNRKGSIYLFAEIRIEMHPNAIGTQVILLAFPHLMRKQASLILGDLMMIVVIMLLVLALSGISIPIVLFFLTIMVLEVFGLVRHYSKSKTILRRQITKALSLDANLKE